MPLSEAMNYNLVSLPIILEVEDCDSKVKLLKESQAFVPTYDFFPLEKCKHLLLIDEGKHSLPLSQLEKHSRVVKEVHSVLSSGLHYILSHIISIGGENLGMAFFILLISFSIHVSELSLINSRGWP